MKVQRVDKQEGREKMRISEKNLKGLGRNGVYEVQYEGRNLMMVDTRRMIERKVKEFNKDKKIKSIYRKKNFNDCEY